jgi:hypothetical protein
MRKLLPKLTEIASVCIISPRQETAPMRGRKTIYPITLTGQQKKHLQQLVMARNTPQGQARRAQVIVLAAEHPE